MLRIQCLFHLLLLCLVASKARYEFQQVILAPKKYLYLIFTHISSIQKF